MVAITIAVPVYNGGDYLARALEAIRRQSFVDYCVLIFDNASTDDTASIAQDMAARDPRFAYVRQAENRGALANFVDALEAASTPYFVWHAVDDAWDDNSLAELLALLEGNPGADLAVGLVRSTDLDGRLLRTHRFKPVSNLALRALRIHPSWIYGLFRREPLAARVAKVWTQYHHPWAWDHLTLFPFVIGDRVAGTTDTTFHLVIRRSKLVPRARPRVLPDLRLMSELRKRFAAIAAADIDALDASMQQRTLLRLLLPIYVGKRVYRLRRMWYRRLRAQFSRTPPVAKVDERSGFETYY